MNLAFHKLGEILKAKEKNDEGAWHTQFEDISVLKILSTFRNIRIGIDMASTSLYKEGEYHYSHKTIDKNEQIAYINSLIHRFNLFYIEDPLFEEDFQGFSEIIRSDTHLVVGDDLTVTHIDKLKEAIKNNSINAMIIKPNQNGSLLEVKKVFDLCKQNNIRTILSHRSGETLDNALADYAVGFQADFIKCGISTQWRTAKLHRLLDIEKQIK
jgi:enolase